jgi:lysophospholipase L1-like esterase
MSLSIRIRTILSIICLVAVYTAEAGIQTVGIDTNSTALDNLKIVYFGSSVPYGQGATNHIGYTALFTKILEERKADGTGKAWKTVNISVPGDNTVKLLKRWSADLPPQRAKYVMYALSLGNEGLHEFGKVKYDQFKANMIRLIKMAKDNGYIPIICNCYTRNDYTLADYSCIKQMDMWIHTLDVPSINLLGAIDDGNGKWMPGYWSDTLHPNDAGHLEMAYTIVPSLFDALYNGKSDPKMVNTSYLTLGDKKTGNTLLYFKADNIVHPFTTCITIKTNGTGQILQLKDRSGSTGYLTINNKGFIDYRSAQQQSITGTTKVNDGQWHKIILTHYYARGETDLYCDSIQQGIAKEKLQLTTLYLGNKNAAKGFSAKNWLFYRAGMNATEIKSLAADTLLKSSLELYAPLDGQHKSLKNPLVNLAQSTDGIKRVK